MDHYYHTLGEDWFTYPRLYREIVLRAQDGAHFVEVGSWKGRSAAFLAVEIVNSEKDIQLDCVDLWEPVGHDIAPELYKNVYETFLKNIYPVRDVVRPVKMLSVTAAATYQDQSLDFVFIDASHDYQSVRQDILAWLPKVKPGGTIAGHDYDRYPVARAVQEIFEKVESRENCWIHVV